MIFEKVIIRVFAKQFASRCDDDGTAFYFSPENFEGLKHEAFDFVGDNSVELRGCFYYYGEKRTDRIIVFDHGMGAGHRAYMKEIELLAKNGYTVYSYDHTGCGRSGGDSMRGFAQSLNDLDHCLTALKAAEEYAHASYSVIGHSWGGFSTLNIGALHPDVTHLVAIAGFLSVESVLKGFFPGIMRGYIPALQRQELETNPDYAGYSALDSLTKTNAKLLAVYSSDDPMVKWKNNYLPLSEALCERKDTYFLTFSDRAHNPNYTTDAVRYKDAFFATVTKMKKKGALDTDEAKARFVAEYDWERMTAQDTELWEKILEFLEK